MISYVKRITIKIVFMVIICFCLDFCVCFLIGCGKPTYPGPSCVEYKIEEKYILDEDIIMTINLGTIFKKKKFEQIGSPKLMITIINRIYVGTDREFVSNPSKYDEAEIITTIDDFYYENYPLIIKRKGCHGIVESYQIPSHIEYVLPKSLFVGDDGEILIGCLEGRGINITRIKYNINDKYIYLTKLAY